MKNIQSTSLKTDLGILVVFLLIGGPILGGFLLPKPFLDDGATLFNIAVSIALALLVWCVFHLIEPRRYSQKWARAEFTVVPLVWVLIMLALSQWFHHLVQVNYWWYFQLNELTAF